jgi:hypothetical protein
MTFISSPLSILGIQSPTSVISGSAYLVTSSVSESWVPYDASLQRLLGGYTGSYQNRLLLWSNDGGDGRLYLSELSSSTVPISDITFFYLNSLDNQLPSTDTNPANTSAVVFDIFTAANNSDCYYQYSRLKWSNTPYATMEVPGADLTSASFSGSMVFTIPGTGSYAFIIVSRSYASNTSSLYFYTGSAGKLLLTGVTDFNDGGLSGDYNNGHVLLLESQYGPDGLEGFIYKNPITVTSYYYKTGSYGRFEIPGNVTSSFLPGTIVEIAGYELLIDGTVYDTSSSEFLTSVPVGAATPPLRTWVYTVGYPNPNIYYPVSASLGFTDAYVLGYNNIASNKSQLVAGMYSTANNQDKLVVIGNGTSTTNRSDVFTVSRTSVSIGGSLIVTGSITGNLSGTASWANNASIAVSASNVAVSSTNTNETYYLHFGNQTSGYDNVEVDTQLNYNPSANQLSISGSIILSASAPTAVAGGIYYDGTNFYLGF